MTEALGHRRWAIPEGYIPTRSNGPEPEMLSHETVSLLNAGDRDANISITLFFSDREPAGPYRVTVPARRTAHVRFNNLTDPEPVPKGTDFASVIESDVPVVAQHTRLELATGRECADDDHGLSLLLGGGGVGSAGQGRERSRSKSVGVRVFSRPDRDA